MAPHRLSSRKSYGWTAGVYASAERLLFGSQLMRARLVLLPLLKAATNILILGEGDGRFLAALLQQNPRATVTVVDRSRRMLERAARRVSARNVQFIQQDAFEFLTSAAEAPPFDAIVTLFVLDCLTESEVSGLVATAARKLAGGGAWLWADFAIPNSGPFRPIARIMLTLLYWFFRATTDTSGSSLVDAAPHFQAARMRVVAKAVALAGMLESRYMQLDETS